ncbi:hypothetical protein [Pelagicoccus albus]|uniref:Uncharacterized protein n=1 Tax=Pelagicoccus albus TaxID=415222 RepID=A0A7X1E6Z9_9BACT|nr:hypothetical protein [Pelagicoccus albus]MBC2604819.1 hypothetical protein [Pelagicoccus albus]
MQRKKIALLLGTSFLVVHTVVLAFCFLYSQSTHEEAPMVWLLLVFGDFPVSLGLFLPFLHIEGNYEWNNIYLPLVYHGLLGSLWWLFLPSIVIQTYSKFKNRTA